MTDESVAVGADPERDPAAHQHGAASGFRAFVLSDIRGYSSFAAARGDEAAAALTERFVSIAERVLGEFGGESLGNRGDEVLFAFESPRQAIRAALAFEQALLDATREDPTRPMPAGIGIDVGEAVVVTDGWRANAINVAARLCSLAKGGEILATREVTHLAQAIDGVRYTARPATNVKGIAAPVNPMRVVSHAGDTARGFAELGFTHAEAPPARRRANPRVLAAGLATVLIAAAAIVVVLVAGGSSSVRLAANELGAIDAKSGQVSSAVRMSTPPTSVAVGKDASIWVVSASAGTLTRIDPATNATSTINVGNDPVAVAVSPADGSIWVANSGDGTVSRVSPENNSVVAKYQVGTGPSALVASSGAVWVANTLSASVSRIDIASGDVRSFSVGSEPAGIAAGAGSIWVADQGDGTVYRLDQQTGAVIAGPIALANGLVGIAFGDGAAWVVNSTAGTLVRIDAQSNTVTGTQTVGQGPNDVAVAPRGVWVSDEYANAIVQVDPDTLTIAHSTPTNSAPLGLALAGNRLWVATDGAGAAAHRGGVLDMLAATIYGPFPGFGDPPTIDPGTEADAAQWRVLVSTSDGLAGYRREGGVVGNQLVPDLAVTLPAPTDNGLIYTFHIRSGIRYSNGVLLRASDFRRGLERAFKVGGGPAGDLGLIVGAQRCVAKAIEAQPCEVDLSHGMVADDSTNTLTIHLTKPDPDLFAQLALPVAYPVPPGTAIKLPSRTVPGTGPYEISSYSPDLSDKPGTHGLLVLKRNPYFRQWSAAAQPTGFPNQIVIRTNYSVAQELTAVKQGRADMTWDPPPQSDVTALSQNFPSQLYQSPGAQVSYVWLNARSAPFDSLLARQALNYAVDRKALGQLPLGGNSAGGRPTCQLLPPDFPGYIPYCPYTQDPTASGQWLAPDLLKARALVRESGTQGRSVTFVEPSFTPPGSGEELISALRAIGYRPRLVDLSPSAFLHISFRTLRRFQAGFQGWSGDYVEPAQVIPELVQCSTTANPALTNGNWGQFCDPSLDARIARALNDETANPALATQEWAAIDHQIVNEAIDVPLTNQLNPTFLAQRVGDYQYNPQWGVLIDQLWVR